LFWSDVCRAYNYIGVTTMSFNIPIASGAAVDFSGSVSIGGFADSAALDAFARLRVSNPVTLFENKQIFDKGPLIWTESTIGGGLITYNNPRASTFLSVAGANGDTAIRQTKQRVNYQPGKSLLIMTTFVLGSGATNVRKRVGYFDASDGIFLEQDNSTINMVLRSSAGGGVSENRVARSSWNLDKLDGTGPSGIVFDATKAQILVMDIEWLGVGRVRTGFVYNGIPVYVHEFNRANTLSGVYMSSPNLPIRYEISNTANGSAANLEEICSTAISEGGYTELGILRSANRFATAISVTSGNGLVPLISIRLKSAYVGTTIVPIDFSIISQAATNYLWELILNPTVTGPDNASWTPMSNSAIEYDISRTTANSLSGGTVIKSGYIVGQGNTVTAASSGDLRSLLVMSADVANISDQLVLAVRRLDAGGGVNYFGSISWREML
jgi:hypothetical protein